MGTDLGNETKDKAKASSFPIIGSLPTWTAPAETVPYHPPTIKDVVDGSEDCEVVEVPKASCTVPTPDNLTPFNTEQMECRRSSGSLFDGNARRFDFWHSIKTDSDGVRLSR